MKIVSRLALSFATAALLLGAAACDSSPSTESEGEGETTADADDQADADGEPESEPQPEPEPEAEPEPEPEPESASEPEPVEIVNWAQHGTTISLQLRNNNERFGLSRAGFEVTLLDADGAILGVIGQEGFPGALCCTIYQLPPASEGGLALDYFEDDEVADIEFRLADSWEVWDELEPADIGVSDTSIRDSGLGPSITGRLSTQEAEPINVWIVASVDTPDGVLVITGIVECLAGGDSRPFEVESFLTEDVGPYELGAVSAYSTSVPGSERTFDADC